MRTTCCSSRHCGNSASQRCLPCGIPPTCAGKSSRASSSAPAGTTAIGWRSSLRGWPGSSARGSGTWRTSTEAAAGDQARLGELLRAGDVMVQPFVSEVRDRGEWSILFLGGQLSHAVLKRPAEGDYRVQWEFGGSAVTMAPPPTLVADAEAVMAAVPGDPVYARVDGVERDGHLVLMELELIEPHLFLGWHAGAATRLAASIGALVIQP